MVLSFFFTMELAVTPIAICVSYTNDTTRLRYGSGVDQLYHQRGSCLSSLSHEQNVSKRHMMAVQLLATM